MRTDESTNLRLSWDAVFVHHATTCPCRVTSSTSGRIEDNSVDDMHSATAGIDCGSHASSQSMYPVYTSVGCTLLS